MIFFLLELDIVGYCCCFPLLCGSFLVSSVRGRYLKLPQTSTQALVSQRSRDGRASILEAAQAATMFSFQKQHNRGPGGCQCLVPAVMATLLGPAFACSNEVFIGLLHGLLLAEVLTASSALPLPVLPPWFSNLPCYSVNYSLNYSQWIASLLALPELFLTSMISDWYSVLEATRLWGKQSQMLLVDLWAQFLICLLLPHPHEKSLIWAFLHFESFLWTA